MGHGFSRMLRIDTDYLSAMIRRIRTTNPKIRRRLERILLRGFLCALRVLAVNAGQHFHREDAKDAKKTRRSLVCGSAALRVADALRHERCECYALALL